MRFLTICTAIILMSGCASTEPKIQKQNDNYPYVEIKSPVEYRSEQYPEPDTYAKYPGGKDGLMNYIRMNTRYPINALQDGIYGDVVMTYVIGTDGLIKDIEAVKSPSKDFTKMFVRLIENMDRWQPAILNGKAVAQKYAIKTRFNEAPIFKGN
jgi:outer membrane biosynthesis protein TonB